MGTKIEKVSYDELYTPPSGIVIRAGAIPYMIKGGERYFLLGRYRDNVYTDMGGGCKTSRHERPIDCLLREIKEETDDLTEETITKALANPEKCTVWRQTGTNFQDYGYPFRERGGPIYRYYVLVEINDLEMKLGGPTFKHEVVSYRWIPEKRIKLLTQETFSEPCRSFLIKQGIIKQAIANL